MRAPAPSVSDWRAVWAIFTAGLAASAYMTKVPPALPGMRAELGLTLVEGSLVATMFNLVGGFTGMLAGVICDRLGYKRVAVGGLLVLALGGVLGALAESFLALLASRFLEGAGFILCVVSAPTLLTAVTASVRDRVRALGLWGAYMPTGGTLALLAAPALVAAWGWRGLWVALAIAAALGALLFWRAVPTPPAGTAPARSLRLIGETLRCRGYIAMAALFALYVAQWTSVLILLPSYLVERGVTTGAAAIATAAMVAANIPGSVGASLLLARGVRRGPLIVGAAALAALCEAGMLSEALPGALRFGLVLVFSMAGGVIPGAIFSGLPVHAPSRQHIATGNGMVLQTSQIGQFLGPLAVAYAATHLGGWDAALWVMLAFAGATAACGYAVGAIESRLSPGATIAS
ncbi:MAG TPA: MFS transporter [Burkholderiales bacterium]|nr:MFS transporter [Burkholderiales bacterium]